MKTRPADIRRNSKAVMEEAMPIEIHETPQYQVVVPLEGRYLIVLSGRIKVPDWTTSLESFDLYLNIPKLPTQRVWFHIHQAAPLLTVIGVTDGFTHQV